MDFTSLPPPRPPPRLGLPRAILSNLAASGFVQIRLQTFATVKISVKIWWIWFVLKIFKTILSRDVCATGKDSEVYPKRITQPFSRNFGFPCRYELIDLIFDWHLELVERHFKGSNLTSNIYFRGTDVWQMFTEDNHIGKVTFDWKVTNNAQLKVFQLMSDGRWVFCS